MKDPFDGRRPMVDTFVDRLASAVAEADSPLCVGIDPHASVLAGWDLPDSARGAGELGLRVVEAASSRVGVVKIQVAFFERFGAAGYAALEEVLAAAAAAGLLTIADVKRGDIGTSVDAYGEAWLSPGSPIEADAMTAVAYQGLGSLDSVLDGAADLGKGVFVLAATSNPEAALTQQAVRADGLTVAAGLVSDIRARGSASIGVVLGATLDLAAFGLDTGALGDLPILAPGFGAQGARIGEVPAIFGTAAPRVLVAVSRSVLEAGPDGLGSAIDRANEEVAVWRS